MKTIRLLTAVAIALALVGCGHNIVSDCQTVGLDLSFPIFGYPFGVRLGKVKTSTNCLRGNAAYMSQSNGSTNVLSGDTQSTRVTQFSANTQINEGYINQFLSNQKIQPAVKQAFIKLYLSKQDAPEIVPITTRTPTSATSAGQSSKIHQTSLQKTISKIGNTTLKGLVKSITKKIFKLALSDKIKKSTQTCLELVGLALMFVLLCAFAKRLLKKRS